MNILLLLVALPFIGAASFWFFPKSSNSLPRWLALITTSIALAILGTFTVGWDASDVPSATLNWIPEIGLSFSIWLDGPALFYSWLVLGIGWLVFWYAGYYMDPKDSPWRFYAAMTFFMGAMLGVVMSRNALLMFVFWELTSISSFLLIGHWHHKESARAGAIRALVTTGAGGLCLLVGLAVVGYILFDLGQTVSFDWDYLWSLREEIINHPAALAAMILMLLGAFTKSAQFPFHYWLPGAMEAPTPVSAYLHAATMVKAGIYLLGRIYPIFSDHIWWLAIVGTVGVLTMTIGGFMAIFAKDLKQLLAFSTVSQLGLLTAYYGFGYHKTHDPDHLLKMDLLLVASHAFFKGALFMLVGIIDHALHTRDYRRMGGLIKTMPVTAILTIIGCLSMAGVPLTFGFIAKELFLHESLHLAVENPVWNYLPFLAVFSSIFTVAYCYRVIISPFFGKLRDKELHPHEGGIGILFAPALLISLCVIGGIFLPVLEKPIGALTNQEFYSYKSGFKIAFFKYVDIILFISAGLFFVAGPLVHFFSGKLENIYKSLGSPTFFATAYDKIFIEFVPWFAKTSHGLIQSPSLKRNLMMTLLAFVVLMLYPVWNLAQSIQPSTDRLSIDILSLTVSVFVVVLFSIFFIFKTQKKLLRLISLSAIGMMVALYFLGYKAPDLMLTQILVEIATLFMFLLLLAHLPRHVYDNPGKLRQVLPIGISLAVGLIFALINFGAIQSPDRSVPILENNLTHREYFIANSKDPLFPEGHGGGGYNVVNVILVDFRGIDTFGEIVVLGLAAMGGISLLLLRQKETKPFVNKGYFEQDLGEDQSVATLPTKEIIPKRISDNAKEMISQYAFPISFLMLSLSAVLFFTGHNAPGGGFIAGLLSAIALAPYFLYYNRKNDPYGKLDPFKLVPIGIVIAMFTGLGSILLGAEFLKSATEYVEIPLFGDVGFASATIFDLGVYLIVVGATLKLIRTFGRY